MRCRLAAGSAALMVVTGGGRGGGRHLLERMHGVGHTTISIQMQLLASRKEKKHKMLQGRAGRRQGAATLRGDVE